MKKENISEEEIKEENKPRAFEEFAIDQSILDELDEIEEEIIDTEAEEVQDSPEQLIDEIQIIDIEDKKQEVVDASSSEFINIVRDNINLCTKEIKEISETMYTKGKDYSILNVQTEQIIE